MISFFPGFYKDENVYSVLARCDHYCCLKSYRDSIKSVFGDDNTLPTLEFPCKLGELATTLELDGIDVKTIISNHTMFPLYSPFLPVERQRNITNKMIYGSGKGIKSEIGFLAGSICKKTGLYYCPICSSEEYELYGEAYLHRLHQAQGVFVCGKHHCYLKEYSVKLIDTSRLSFIKLERDQLAFNCETESNGIKLETMLKISSGVEFLLNNDLSYLDKMIVEDSYRKQLKKSGFTTISGRIHQQDLCKAIKDFFFFSILNTFESSLDTENEYNWVRVLTRKGNRVVHPIRHLLFINFLFGDIKIFYQNLLYLAHCAFAKMKQEFDFQMKGF